MPAVEAMRAWTVRQWSAGFAGAVAVALMVGLPTDVIPNPVFGRPVAVTWWSYPVLLVTSVLGGLLIATYVRPMAGPSDGHDADGNKTELELNLETERGAERGAERDAERLAKTGGAGGLLSFFAVGCPVCNKIVLLALGTAGARQWFEPFQPILAILSLALLSYALWSRLSSTEACPIPAERAAQKTDVH